VPLSQPAFPCIWLGFLCAEMVERKPIAAKDSGGADRTHTLHTAFNYCR
jgi:hypothetical protein